MPADRGAIGHAGRRARLDTGRRKCREEAHASGEKSVDSTGDSVCSEVSSGMPLRAADLPSDPDRLTALALTLAAENERLRA